VVDVARMARRCSGREPALDLVGWAAAEHLDQVGMNGTEAWPRLGAEVGVDHCRRELPGDGVEHLVAGDAEPA
jgi:hypothetical protein